VLAVTLAAMVIACPPYSADPVKPPLLARVEYKRRSRHRRDTTAEHTQICVRRSAQQDWRVFNAGPFMPWRYRAEGTAPTVTLTFPGGLGGANWAERNRFRALDVKNR